MSSDKPQARTLREIEMDVLAEGREWMRQRLQQKLQAEADRHGGVFPPQRSQGLASAKPVDAAAKRRGHR